MKCYAIFILAIAIGLSGCVATQPVTQSLRDDLQLEIKELRALVEASNARLSALENGRREIEDQKVMLRLLQKRLAKNIKAIEEIRRSAYEIKEPAGLKVVRLRDEKKSDKGSSGKVGAVAKKPLPEKTLRKSPGATGVITAKKNAAAPKKPLVAKNANLKKRLKSLSTKELYEEGIKFYNAENYTSARVAFELLLKKSPEHNLADNALYWVAETYYAHTRYEKAIEIFTDVAKSYPDSNKTPDSLLKVGYSYLELESFGEADKAFKKLIELYPETQAASRARERLRKSLN